MISLSNIAETKIALSNLDIPFPMYAEGMNEKLNHLAAFWFTVNHIIRQHIYW